MNIVKWNEPVDVSILGEKEKREVFHHMLKGYGHNTWNGQIVRKAKAKDKMEGLHIQLRKNTGEAQVVIHYGIRKPQLGWQGRPIGKVPTKPSVLVAQNGTAEYQPEDFAEMNLVILEAKAVYESLIEEENNA